jgi:hypothetical protein
MLANFAELVSRQLEGDITLQLHRRQLAALLLPAAPAAAAQAAAHDPQAVVKAGNAGAPDSPREGAELCLLCIDTRGGDGWPVVHATPLVEVEGAPAVGGFELDRAVGLPAAAGPCLTVARRAPRSTNLSVCARPRGVAARRPALLARVRDRRPRRGRGRGVGARRRCDGARV